MKTIALDTETFLIAPGSAAPPMVCTSWAMGSRSGLLHVRDPRCKKLWRKSLRKRRIIGARVAYDAAVTLHQWPDLADDIFAAYEDGRIECIQINQRLEDIANGCLDGRYTKEGKRIRYKYSLAALTGRRLLKFRAKDADTYRLRYGELYDVTQIKHWPADAIKYAIADAEDCLPLDKLQQASGLVRDGGAQAYADFALYLMTCRGIRTERKACKVLIKSTKKLLRNAKRQCERAGLIDPKTGKKKSNEARKRMATTLGVAPKEIKQLAREHDERAAQRIDAKIAKLAFDYQLSDKQLSRARKKLAKFLELDVSHTRMLEKWERAGYTRDLYRALRSELEYKTKAYSVRLASGQTIRLTKTGLIKIDAEACKESGDPVLRSFAVLTSANTLLKKAQRMLKGTRVPLQTSYLSLVETGRTSSRASDDNLIGDNFQNFRRDMSSFNDVSTELPGQRECIIARPGYVLCSIDFNAAEMRSFAQLAYSKLGWSKIRDTLNRGRDPHLALAAKSILRISYKEAKRRLEAGDAKVARARQYAKIPNFALLGGGGWRILPDYAKGMDIELSAEQAKELYAAFHEAWPEVAAMHKHFGKFVHARYEHPISRRLRYLTRYAQACNNPFQGLTADAAKYAVCVLAREEYTSTGCLRGAHSLLFMHDEVIFELPENRASELAWRATKLMIDAYNRFTPDVPMTAEPSLMRRLSKGAKTVLHPTKRDRDGNRLLLVYGENDNGRATNRKQAA